MGKFNFNFTIDGVDNDRINTFVNSVYDGTNESVYDVIDTSNLNAKEKQIMKSAFQPPVVLDLNV